MTQAPVRLYNTMTQELEDFVPLVPGKVGMYVCGPTVQDVAHAGHARTYTTFDVLRRFLRARGFEVKYVRNITDVDDKIIAKAAEKGEDALAYSKRMSVLFLDDLAAVGCEAPDDQPRVSSSIDDIIQLTERLIEKGHAYVAETPKGRDVYFAVRSYADYGRLSRRKIDDLLVGARIEVGEIKKDPLDFALWKGDDSAAVGWASPWGKGRPGWHIECSAMCVRSLGEHFDIHGGGMDLIFPHHENEIAQSEASFGPPLSRFWMHAGFLTIDAEKMSKSLGNFVTVRDLLGRNDPEAIRYYFLGVHYRGPLAFDVTKLDSGRVLFPSVDEAEKRMDYLYATRDAVALAADGAAAEYGTSGVKPSANAVVVSEAYGRVLAALDKDLNTPVAIAVIGDLAKAANEIALQVGKLKKDPVAQAAVRGLAAAASEALTRTCGVLGLLQASPADYAARTRARRLELRGLQESDIEAKVQARIDARTAKDFARSDELRKELSLLGIEVYDAGNSSTWRVTA